MEGGGFIVEPVAEGEIVTGNRARSDPQPSTRSVTSPGHERVALQGSGCSKCSSLTFSEEFSKSFGVLLCNQCRRSESLISKSTAKQRYQVTDGDLKKLGSVRRSNPHRKDWQPMQLYMESQVRQVAYEKHGGEEGLQRRAHEIVDKKIQERLRKREEGKEREERKAKRLQDIKAKILFVGDDPSGAPVDESEVEDI